MEFYDEDTTLSWAARHPEADEILSEIQKLGAVIWADWIASQDIYDKDCNLDGRHMTRMVSQEIEWFDCSLNGENEIQLPVEWERDNSEIFELAASELCPPKQEVVDTLSALLTEKDAFVMGDTVMIKSYLKETVPFFYDYQQSVMWEWEEQYIGEKE